MTPVGVTPVSIAKPAGLPLKHPESPSSGQRILDQCHSASSFSRTFNGSFTETCHAGSAQERRPPVASPGDSWHSPQWQGSSWQDHGWSGHHWAEQTQKDRAKTIREVNSMAWPGGPSAAPKAAPASAHPPQARPSLFQPACCAPVEAPPDPLQHYYADADAAFRDDHNNYLHDFLICLDSFRSQQGLPSLEREVYMTGPTAEVYNPESSLTLDAGCSDFRLSSADG